MNRFTDQLDERYRSKAGLMYLLNSFRVLCGVKAHRVTVLVNRVPENSFYLGKIGSYDAFIQVLFHEKNIK